MESGLGSLHAPSEGPREGCRPPSTCSRRWIPRLWLQETFFINIDGPIPGQLPKNSARTSEAAEAAAPAVAGRKGSRSEMPHSLEHQGSGTAAILRSFGFSPSPLKAGTDIRLTGVPLSALRKHSDHV